MVPVTYRHGVYGSDIFLLVVRFLAEARLDCMSMRGSGTRLIRKDLILARMHCALLAMGNNRNLAIM